MDAEPRRYRVSRALASVLMLTLCSATGSLRAQDTVTVGVRSERSQAKPLPRRVAEDAVAFYNRSSTIRLSGRTVIPRHRSLDGDVGLLGGPVQIEGRIHGDMVVINGDVTLGEGGRIDGDLTVIGGVVEGAEEGRVGGIVQAYSGLLRYRRTPQGIAYVGTVERHPPASRTRLRLPEWTLGESEIYVSSGAYNRAEGLPITFGPRITTGDRNPLHLEAFAIYRTEAGFDVGRKDFGYRVDARQYVGGTKSIWAEVGVRSVIDPIEHWQLTNLENSLALFFFRRDYRDYYERRGWYGRIAGRLGRSLTGGIEYRDEDHSTVSAHSPWTILFNTDDSFQPNARIQAGDLRSLVLDLTLDTRNDRDVPGSGWYNQVQVERALTGRLAGREPDFTDFFLDLRRYNRVSPAAAVALRLVAGGRAGGSFLPAQREHVIGGVGSLPGYDQRQFDCGVRSNRLISEVAAYGCERFALFQAEYRTNLDFDLRWDGGNLNMAGDFLSVDFEPDLVLFYDAGSAWNTGTGYFDQLTKSDNWVADVGAGLELGGLGLYLAYPLSGSGGFNFFVRLAGRL